jgi:Flp pilus assembly pilin Flp
MVRGMFDLCRSSIRLGRDADGGQGLAEYALILSLIALLAIVSLIFIGGDLSTMLSDIGSSV